MSTSTIFKPESLLMQGVSCLPGIGVLSDYCMGRSLNQSYLDLSIPEEFLPNDQLSSEIIYERLKQTQNLVTTHVDRFVKRYELIQIVRSVLTLALLVTAVVCPMFGFLIIPFAIMQMAPALIIFAAKMTVHKADQGGSPGEIFFYGGKSSIQACLFYFFTKYIPVISIVSESINLVFQVTRIIKRHYDHCQELKSAPTFKAKFEDSSSKERELLREPEEAKGQDTPPLKTVEGQRIWLANLKKIRELAKIEKICTLYQKYRAGREAFLPHEEYWLATHPQQKVFKDLVTTPCQFIHYCMKCPDAIGLLDDQLLNRNSNGDLNINAVFDMQFTELYKLLSNKIFEKLRMPGSFLDRNETYSKWAQTWVVDMPQWISEGRGDAKMRGAEALLRLLYIPEVQQLLIIGRWELQKQRPRASSV